MPNQPSDLKSFYEAVKPWDFLVLDTETTGLGNFDEIVELAIIDSAGKTLFNELIKPTIKISADATRVTGISDRMVADKLPWSAHVTTIAEIIKGRKIVTYNATFDRKMFHQTDRAHEFAEMDWQGIAPWYCAMTAFAERYGNWNDYRQSYQWCKLVDAVGFYDILPQQQFHGAHADASMTLDVIRAMVAEIDKMQKERWLLESDDFWKSMIGVPFSMNE
jgi:DNA polymerase III epsilon subunit-like protein